MVGLAVSVIDLLYPHKWSTMIELDYGTPFGNLIDGKTHDKIQNLNSSCSMVKTDEQVHGCISQVESDGLALQKAYYS